MITPYIKIIHPISYIKKRILILGMNWKYMKIGKNIFKKTAYF